MRLSNITRNRREYLIKKLKFNYDKVNDLFYTYKEDSQVYSNVMIGDFHIEFNKNGEVIGIEVLNASAVFSEYQIPGAFLENIKEINIRIVIRNSLMLICIIINSMNQEKSAMITMNNVESAIMHEIETA